MVVAVVVADAGGCGGVGEPSPTVAAVVDADVVVSNGVAELLAVLVATGVVDDVGVLSTGAG